MQSATDTSRPGTRPEQRDGSERSAASEGPAESEHPIVLRGRPAVLVADEPPRWCPGERLEHLFEARCDALPEHALAVDGPAGSITYRGLDARANQLARQLALSAGLRPGSRVALLLDRPLDVYVAMLAVLKAHGVYVPLDVGLPPSRLGFILDDAGAELVLAGGTHLAAALSEAPPTTRVIYLAQLEAEAAAQPADRLEPRELAPPGDERACPADALGIRASEPLAGELCYVIYTSGTTGRPKGVAISHASICNFVRVAGEVYGVRSDDRMYQGLTIAFDFSVEEIWVAWMAGATLVPKPTPAALVGEELRAFLGEHRVTALCAVPSLLETIDCELPGLRFVLVSGEACPQELVRRWQRPGRRLLNVYGPTEATVSATLAVLAPGRAVTIGVPLPTYSAVVLDPDRERVLSVGEAGELGLAGIGLADGYLGRPELTARAFVADFLALPHNPSARIYRTGDLVRLLESGELEHLGRIDTQVKLRGYRIELGEIEAVLRSLPGVAQVALTVHEAAPGVPELAAYYTSRQDHQLPPDEDHQLPAGQDRQLPPDEDHQLPAGEDHQLPPNGNRQLQPEDLLVQLRERLPAYMVPAYLEPIAAMPLMSSGKLDRRALPRPRRRRLAAPDADAYAPPETELEALLARELAEVLGVERISVDSHFFEVLGANSLLMARLLARLRRPEALGRAVSMRDVYLHPTVRTLAAALAAPTAPLPGITVVGADQPQLPESSGAPHRRLCGLLQLACALVCVATVSILIDSLSGWISGAHSPLELLSRALVAGAACLFGLGLAPVAVKWILIGRWRPERFPIWSFRYLRFWLVKTLSVLNPLPHLLADTPLYPLYLRAMGARVGDGVLILSQHIPVCTDVLSIGSGSVIGRDAYLNGYRARGGMIEIGPVEIGPGAFVGERCVLDIDTRIGADAQLGHASSLLAGQAVPAGACWNGSPAQPAADGYDYRTVPPLPLSRLRQVRYAATRLLILLLIAGPLEALLGIVLIGHPSWIERLGPTWLFALPALVVAGIVLLSLALAAGGSRLLARLLEPGRPYPLYGSRYAIQRMLALVANNTLLTGLLGDSVAIVHYLRLLGYHFGTIEQTGSNFGLDVKQDVPTLSHIGTGTMASDGLSIAGAEFSSSSFRVRPVVIGRHNYIGNTITFPPGARTGDNVLFATKAMVPLAGPVRHDVGLLGSPCIEIPRTVRRDQELVGRLEPAERARRLAAKTRHNLVTMALHLLVDYLLILGWIAVASAPLGGTGLRDWAGGAASLLLEASLMLALFVLAERAVTGFRRLRPRSCSILQIDFWRHERYWKVAPTNYVRLLDGTPLKPVLWRLLGVPIGRGVFDDGLAITERTLVSIGDRATFNMGSALQSHTLEDGVFKSDLITVGEGATVGTAALINYDVILGDGAVVEADAFVMKGSRVEPGSRWQGNPATEVAARRVDPRPGAGAPGANRTGAGAPGANVFNSDLASAEPTAASLAPVSL